NDAATRPRLIRVHDFVDFVFGFAVDFDQWGWGVSGEGVRGMAGKEADVENRVKGFHTGRESKSVGVGGDLFGDFEGAQAFVI
ncbi:hypothetical protein C0992_001373, partial [Termitomyces sp. T32_za158]